MKWLKSRLNENNKLSYVFVKINKPYYSLSQEIFALPKHNMDNNKIYLSDGMGSKTVARRFLDIVETGEFDSNKDVQKRLKELREQYDNDIMKNVLKAYWPRRLNRYR